MSELPSNYQGSCTNSVVGTDSKPFYQEKRTAASAHLALDKEPELQPTDNELITATKTTLSEATVTTSSFSVIKKSEPVVTSAAAAEESFHLKWNVTLSSSSPIRNSSLPDYNENHVFQEDNFVRDFLREFEDADCRNGGEGTLDVGSYTTPLDQQQQQQQQWSTATDAATNTSWKENPPVQLRYPNPDGMDLSYGLSRPSSPSSFIPMSFQSTEVTEPFSLSSAAYNGNNYHSLRQPTMQHYQGRHPQRSVCFHRCYCHYVPFTALHHPHCHHDSPSTPSLISSSNGVDNGFFQPLIPPQSMHPQYHHTCSSTANQVLFGMGENDLSDASDMATVTPPATGTTTTTATISNGNGAKDVLPNEHSYPFSSFSSTFDNISIAQNDSKRTAAPSLTAKKNGKQVITNYQKRQRKQASMSALKAKATLPKTTIQKSSLLTPSSPRESPTAALSTSPYPDVIGEAPKTILLGQSIPGQQSSRRTRTSYDPKTSYHLNVLFYETFGSHGRKPTKKERRKVEKHTGISSRRLTYWLSKHKRRYALELQAFLRLTGEGLIHGYDSFVNYCRHNDVPELRRIMDVDEQQQQPGSSADHANHQQQQSSTEEDEDYDVDDETEYNDSSNSSKIPV